MALRSSKSRKGDADRSVKAEVPNWNLRLVNAALAEQLSKLWPVLLIVGGLAVLGRYFFGGGRKEG